MNFISFNDHIVKEKINQYAGSEKKKTVVMDDGKTYLLKFPDPSRKNNVTISYINNALSEYIGCKVVASVGLPVQQVMLGIYDTGTKEKVACACLDVRGEGENLIEIEKVLLSDLDSQNSKTILLSDMNTFMQRNTYVDPGKMVEHYYRQFVVDALIGNTDRHNGNWGVIESRDGEYRLSPIFDCGSSLSPLVADDEIDASTISSAVMGTASALSDERGRITYKRFFETSEDPNFVQALRDLAFHIDMKKIHSIVDEIPDGYLSEKRRQFYHDILQMKYDKIFVPAFRRCLAPNLQDVTAVREEMRMECEDLEAYLRKMEIGESDVVTICGEDLGVRKIRSRQVLLMNNNGDVAYTPIQVEQDNGWTLAATVSLMLGDAVCCDLER